MAKKNKDNRSEQTRQVIDLLKLGHRGTDIAKQLSVTPATVYSIKRHYKTEIETTKDNNITIDIENYKGDLNNNLKKAVSRYSNHLANLNLQKLSPQQAATIFGIMYDKLRLEQGKSTQNIATQIAHSLSPEAEQIIRESIKSLKESMLRGAGT